MFKSMPVQFWLLILIGIFAYTRVANIYRRVSEARSRFGGALPIEDPQSQPMWPMALDVGILVGLAALSVFIFTQAAADLAHSRLFWPLTLSALTFYLLYDWIKSYLSGVASISLKGSTLGPYVCAQAPKRYWAAMRTNGLFTALFAYVTFVAIAVPGFWP